MRHACQRAFGVAALVALIAAASIAADPPNRPAAGGKKSFDPKKIETRAVKLLAAGKQGEAEQLLQDSLDFCPSAVQVVALAAGGKQKEAQQVFEDNKEQIKKAQRLLFLNGAVIRSRFEKQLSFVIFSTVLLADPTSPSGQCAELMVKLDSEQVSQAATKSPEVADAIFKEFAKLADDIPDDVVIRWLAAIQCRTWNRNEEGVEHYKKILEKWKPGPAMVHQTYANLLDELHRYEDALVDRKIMIKMEPEAWAYQGLGNTLHHLKRFEEANAAFIKATALQPDNAQFWVNWAYSLEDEGEFEASIEKCQKAIGAEPKFPSAYDVWGSVLEKQDKLPEAAAKFKEGLAIEPENQRLKAGVARVEQKLKK